MLILWATEHRSPYEAPSLLANAIALRLRVRGVAPVAVEPITGLGALPVLEITEAARQKQASLLIISTEARKGVRKLIHPSLTEAVIGESTVPVLVMGPNCARVRDLGRRQTLIFSTDFAEHSQRDWRKMVAHTKTLGFKLELHHPYEWPIETLVKTVQAGSYLLSGAAPDPHPMVWAGTLRADRHGQAWIRWARHQGVECNWTLDDAPGSANEHLLAAANRVRCSSIILSRRAALKHWSRTRELIRDAPCPVGFLP